MKLVWLGLILLLAGCEGGPGDSLVAPPSPSPSASSPSAAASGQPQATVTPPPDLDAQIEAAVSRCLADYRDSLTGRVPDTTITRSPGYATLPLSSQRVEYRTTLKSNFIHIDASSGTGLMGKYVREIDLCSLDYDASSGQYRRHSEIRIEETTRPGA